MKPLDFIRTKAGNVGIITEVSATHGIHRASISFLKADKGERSECHFSRWWKAHEFDVIDNLPDILSRNMADPLTTDSLQPFSAEATLEDAPRKTTGKSFSLCTPCEKGKNDEENSCCDGECLYNAPHDRSQADEVLALMDRITERVRQTCNGECLQNALHDRSDPELATKGTRGKSCNQLDAKTA